ncbi:phosphoesterase RecJ-like protein [Mycoplasmoides fastidiosum]|uniref:Phosphoesterase RecJ-like protein n=1 Tax=Mycoplasmoides fastidiosum TaxID=92758 RepID=A0ABU0LYL1_9BACT|nr:bifunctional oligoribonuclease/PAP phosphatase NrnA [Mycoplasmoides fastidiosum]MDQ0513802.1 phosphoesterase RecJ-like protein [Mycoplasmoides fastidiosum]UUD37780.1 bifunctional oligoribonuclease/PAP phosphatase NrnA [Mycoplasmoides fastidiosum]
MNTTKNNMKKELEIFHNIENLIKSHDNIFIFHHVYPDGDCLGAQFGLLNLIKLNFPEKQVFAIGDHENLYPFLPKTNTNLENLDTHFLQNSLAIVVDGDGSRRVAKSQYLYNPKIFKTSLRIDHHNSQPDIQYDYEWDDHLYTSVAEQIGWMAKNLHWKMNKLAADFLYLGINTDSGRMSFERTNARTFSTLSYLCQNGLKPYDINLEINRRTENQIRFMGYVLTNMKIVNQFVYCFITQEVIKKFNLNVIEANDANMIGNIKGTKLWAFFVELEDGRFRIRLRSNSIKVENSLAPFGLMGGHYFSTAGTFKKEQTDAIIEYLKEFSLNEK